MTFCFGFVPFHTPQIPLAPRFVIREPGQSPSTLRPNLASQALLLIYRSRLDKMLVYGFQYLFKEHTNCSISAKSCLFQFRHQGEGLAVILGITPLPSKVVCLDLMISSLAYSGSPVHRFQLSFLESIIHSVFLSECVPHNVYCLTSYISFTSRDAIEFTRFGKEIRAKKSFSNFSHIGSRPLILNILNLLNFPFS